MIYNIIGVEDLNYKKKTGDMVDAWKLYTTYNTANIVGSGACDLYFKKDFFPLAKNVDYFLGKDLEVERDHNGKVIQVEII